MNARMNTDEYVMETLISYDKVSFIWVAEESRVDLLSR